MANNPTPKVDRLREMREAKAEKREATQKATAKSLQEAADAVKPKRKK
jgi:hypothetical protein